MPSNYIPIVIFLILATAFPIVALMAAKFVRPDSPFLAKLRQTFLPNHVLVVAAEGQDLAAQSELVPLLKAKVAQDGAPVAYVCEQGICELPTGDPEVFARQLSKAAAAPTPDPS